MSNWYDKPYVILTKTVGDHLPVGSIIQDVLDRYGDVSLECNGQGFDADQYPELAKVMNTYTWGTDEDGRPVVPDLRGTTSVTKKRKKPRKTPPKPKKRDEPVHTHSEGLCSCGEPKNHPRGYYRG